MAAIDLNALRKVVTSNQADGTVLPNNPTKQVVVNSEGKVQMGNQVSTSDAVTHVPQETFAKKE